MTQLLLESLRAWWPETILATGGLLTMLSGAWSARRGTAAALAGLTLLSSAVALAVSPSLPPTGTFFGLVICDPFSFAFRWIALGTTAIVVLMIVGSREPASRRAPGEYIGLALIVGLGLMLLAEANHLLSAYLAVEMIGLSTYMLTAMTADARGAEAGLKYLLFGSLASGVMLFGISFLYGMTGELAFPELLRVVLTRPAEQALLLLVPVGLILVGVGFKVSMVPFHMWTPDVYEGAPVPVAALLSVGPKAAGLALLVRMIQALDPLWPALAPVIGVLAVVTMTLGNLVALAQGNVKRLLAYSTIAQVGYLLIGVVAQDALGIQALILYLVAYVFMNLGAFACVVAVVNESGEESLEAFRGLARRSPALAALCTVCLLSLAGIPPLLGFLGKFLVFGAAIHAGWIGLAAAGAANSAIALYYYVNLVRLMYLSEPADARPLEAAWPLKLAVWGCALATLALGAFPSGLLGLIERASHISLL
ncbi:MAG TPA: NADH-quinone oxidoreductase subunit N [bacterium]